MKTCGLASATRRRLRHLRSRTALPVLCLVCGRMVWRDYSLCRECEAELPWLVEACARCGEELTDNDNEDELCSRCRLDPPEFDACFAPLSYRPPVDKLIAGYKFNAEFAGGYALARILARAATARWRGSGCPELLLPVPLHRSRLRRRGFNQALEIAKVLAADSGVPLAAGALRKIRPTPPQTEVPDAKRRRANVRGAFELVQSPGILRARRVALVDDVVTTMSTVAELARILKRAGVEKVEVCCLARAN